MPDTNSKTPMCPDTGTCPAQLKATGWPMVSPCSYESLFTLMLWQNAKQTYKLIKKCVKGFRSMKMRWSTGISANHTQTETIVLHSSMWQQTHVKMISKSPRVVHSVRFDD